MLTRLRLLLTGGLLLLAAGCGDNADHLLGDTLELTTEAVVVLEAINGPESARQAQSRLDALVPRLEELRLREQELELGPEELSRAVDRRATEWEKLSVRAILARMRAEAYGVRIPPGLMPTPSPLPGAGGP